MSVVPRSPELRRGGARSGRQKVRIAIASEEERQAIYRLRHTVYAEEIHQHPVNSGGLLSDDLDRFNVYLTASLGGRLLGFVSVTPPQSPRYSIEKYLSRQELPFPCDDGLHEVRLLTVVSRHRMQTVAPLLMLAAFRWVKSRGGKRIVALGRTGVLGLYLKVGLEPLGRQVRSGAVVFELLSATTGDMEESFKRRGSLLPRLQRAADWQMDRPGERAPCYHGGAFFEAIGDEFDHLERRSEVINADVLDAWFPPSPKVLSALSDALPWLVRTSPPTGCEGLVRTLSRLRGIPEECLVPGAGSSDLIFRAFRHWLTPSSRVLLLDPTYGEYWHVAERVVGCRVERLPLSPEDGFRLEPDRLRRALKEGYDLVVLVNPNSPTGQHAPRRELEDVLRGAPRRTRIWVDETYVEYAGPGESLEGIACRSPGTIVCKSMSKVYALSGLRVAYLAAHPRLAGEVRSITPPWVVGLPAQVAAVQALKDPGYYRGRWAETAALRRELAGELRKIGGMEALEGVTNSLLCLLAPSGPAAAQVCEECRTRGLFLRDASRMSPRLGPRALRIAVKDRPTNLRMVEILRQTAGSPPWGP